MTGPSDFPPEVVQLLDALCEGDLDAQRAARLEELICNDPAVRDLYLLYVDFHVEMRRRYGYPHGSDASVKEADRLPSESSEARLVIPALTETTVPGMAGFFSSGWPVAYLIALLVVGVGILVGSLVPVSQISHFARQTTLPDASIEYADRNVVGRITGTIDCRWEKKVASGEWPVASKLKNTNHKPLTTNHLVSLGDQFVLSAGLMEITYNTGAKVILEGPCTYEVDSAAGGFLSVGKLTARVEQSTKYGVRSTERVANESRNLSSSPQPLAPSPLFAVRTPTAAITDLGTEFGVEVDQRGNTLSLVFRGSVRVQTIGSDGKTSSEERILHENQSVNVECRDGAEPVVAFHTSTPSQLRTFVRELPKPIIKTLDLVDVVAGGTGFGNARGRGIDPTSGAIVLSAPREYTDWEAIRDDGRYHPVESLPLVDGVFVPNNNDGTTAVQLDSAGHVYTGLKTSDRRIFGHLWAGGEIPGPLPPPTGTTMEGIDYASPGHGVLAMIPNKGITFDLQAVRRDNPGFKIIQFRAIVGSMQVAGPEDEWRSADVCVFVDGQVRFSRMNIHTRDGIATFPVSVPLRNSDRFLTLVVTDGGNTIVDDRIIFGDPQLEMALIQSRDAENAGAGIQPKASAPVVVQSIPIDVFSTGLKLVEGDADPHWQVTAVNGIAQFQPRAAVVTHAPKEWLPNEPEQSQWITYEKDGVILADGATCTFRTTFEIPKGSNPESAELNAWFAADNHISEIRLNGRKVPVPAHGYRGYEMFRRFSIREGFVAGTNYMEFDVLNAEPESDPPSASPMGLRVELSGSVQPQSADAEKGGPNPAFQGE